METADLPPLDDDFWEQPIPGTVSNTAESAETLEITNEPRGILDAWVAFEVLSPQSFNRPDDLADGDRRRIAKLADGLPWSGDGEKARPSTEACFITSFWAPFASISRPQIS